MLNSYKNQFAQTKEREGKGDIEISGIKQETGYPSEGSGVPRLTSILPGEWRRFDEIAASEGFRWIRCLDAIRRVEKEGAYPTVSLGRPSVALL